jgi:hypothetical protein
VREAVGNDPNMKLAAINTESHFSINSFNVKSCELNFYCLVFRAVFSLFSNPELFTSSKMYPANNITNGGYSSSSRADGYYFEREPMYSRTEPPTRVQNPPTTYNYQPQFYPNSSNNFHDFNAEQRRHVTTIEKPRFYGDRELRTSKPLYDRPSYNVADRPVSTRLSYHPPGGYSQEVPYDVRRNDNQFTGVGYPASRASSRQHHHPERMEQISRLRQPSYESMRSQGPIYPAPGQNRYINEYEGYRAPSAFNSERNYEPYQRHQFEDDYEERFDRRSNREEFLTKKTGLRNVRSQMTLKSPAMPIREELEISEPNANSDVSTPVEKQQLPTEIRHKSRQMENLLRKTSRLSITDESTLKPGMK